RRQLRRSAARRPAGRHTVAGLPGGGRPDRARPRSTARRVHRHPPPRLLRVCLTGDIAYITARVATRHAPQEGHPRPDNRELWSGDMGVTGSNHRNLTADRAIQLLLLYDDDRPVLTAAEVAERLGMSRSTTYRYLQSLRAAGMLEEDARGFRLGMRIFQLAHI